MVNDPNVKPKISVHRQRWGVISPFTPGLASTGFQRTPSVASTASPRRKCTATMTAMVLFLLRHWPLSARPQRFSSSSKHAWHECFCGLAERCLCDKKTFPEVTRWRWYVFTRSGVEYCRVRAMYCVLSQRKAFICLSCCLTDTLKCAR
jgi:hypothetical protein